MAKQKSFYAKLIAKVKRDSKRYWNVKTMGSIKDHFNGIAQTSVISEEWEALRGGILPPFQFDSYIRSYYENGVFAGMTPEELEGIPLVYPGLMFAWETMPKEMELDASAVGFLKEGGEDFQDAPIGDLTWPFPGCLLIDVCELGFELHGIKVDGVFVYPSYDLDRGYPMLLMLGVNLRRGMFFPLESKLVLDGETLGEAMSISKQENELIRKRVLAGLDRGIHEELFSPLDDEPSFREFVSQILAFSCSRYACVEERRFGGVPHFRVSLNLQDDILGDAESDVRVVEENQPDWGLEVDELASEGKPPSLDDAGLVPDGLEDEGTADCQELSDVVGRNSEDPPDEAPVEAEGKGGDALGQETLLALVESLRSENDALKKVLVDAESQNATLQYHLKQAQRSTDKLHSVAEGLRRRAHLIETMVLPTTPFEALALAERAFSDRLIVLDEARKSARAFERGSADETWRVLQAMAVTLHRLVFEQTSGSLTHVFQAETGFEITLRDVKHTNNNSNFERERRVRYAGEDHNITAHVKGKSVKKGECLRVHFFADYSANKIVIAHCGEHLTTIKTSTL